MEPIRSRLVLLSISVLSVIWTSAVGYFLSIEVHRLDSDLYTWRAAGDALGLVYSWWILMGSFWLYSKTLAGLFVGVPSSTSCCDSRCFSGDIIIFEVFYEMSIMSLYLIPSSSASLWQLLVSAASPPAIEPSVSYSSTITAALLLSWEELVCTPITIVSLPSCN